MSNGGERQPEDLFAGSPEGLELTETTQIDDEVRGWLLAAYDDAG